ncbi:MAG TPA: phosphotransferase [Gaiellaceae bacterium]|nr:phosphotransferase [Gaiellaceae bacterium]
MAEWDADIEIGGPLVRALLTEQFPGLDASSARLLGEGWDNSVWVVEDEWAFRFPRREIAIPGVERELTTLPRLAPLLPAPIPVPRFVGVQSDRFPWPFFGAPLLAGIEPADAELTESQRVELGAALGRFLRVLHTSETREAVDPRGLMPVDPLRRADPVRRVPLTRQLLAELESSGIARCSATGVLDDASRLGASTDIVCVHGDLHLRHVLVEGGSLGGVIDWGDTCVGDPSIDLQIAWSLLPADGRARFFREYGAISEEREVRARMLAVGLCAMLAKYAHAVEHANLEKEALAGLERALID